MFKQKTLLCHFRYFINGEKYFEEVVKFLPVLRNNIVFLKLNAHVNSF